MKEFKSIANAKKLTKLTYLGDVNKSAKLAKNGKISHQMTYGIYLAPANVSGYNTCPFSTPECRKGCLATSGRAGMEIMAGKTKIENCRTTKTKLFYENNEFFMQWLIAEMLNHKTNAEKNGYGFSARLNCTSDIDWQNTYYNGKNIFEIFPDVQFYDYTKNPNKFNNKPLNYHLTFSYTGKNWVKCKELLEVGYNISMIFNVKDENLFPKTFGGYEVVNGDKTDYRVNDGNGKIIGLKFKRIADQLAQKEVINSCFVVQPDNELCQF
jgi:hypothetical protein